MATIQEAQSQVQLRQQDVAVAQQQQQEYQQQVQQAQQKVPSIGQRLLRAIGVSSPLQAQQQRQQIAQQQQRVNEAQQQVQQQGEQIQQYEQGLQEYEQQLNEYLQTDAGKLKYAQESGMKGKPIYDKLGKGYSTELMGYEYDTPYGKVTDWGPRNKLVQDDARLTSMDNEAISNAGYSSPKDFYKAVEQGSISPTELRSMKIFNEATLKEYSDSVKDVNVNNMQKVPDLNLPANLNANRGEMYNAKLGGFIETGGQGNFPQGTATIRAPTMAESEALRDSSIKNSWGVVSSNIPFLAQSKFFDYQLTPEQEQDFYGGTTLQTVNKFLNADYQKKLARSQEELKRDLREYEYLKSKGLTDEEIVGTNQELYNRLSEDRRTATDIIGNSNAPAIKKGIAQAAISGGQLGLYLTPIGRLAAGTDTAMTGIESLPYAKNKIDKALTIGQVALGTGLAVSGVKGTFFPANQLIKLPKITGTPNQMNWLKGATYGSGITLAGAFGTSEYFSILKETNSKSTALGGALATGLGITGATIVPSFVPKKLTFAENLKNSQNQLLEMQRKLNRNAEDRLRNTGGETGLTRSIKEESISFGRTAKETKQEASMLWDMLSNSGITSGIKKSEFIKGFEIGRTRLTTELPTALKTNKILDNGKMSEEIIQLGELGRAGDYTRDLSFVGKRTATTNEISFGVKSKDGAEVISASYQTGMKGKPIKNSVESFITTVDKEGKMLKIQPFKTGRRSRQTIKTDFGDVILEKSSPVRIGQSYYGEIKPIDIGKEIKGFEKSSTELELTTERLQANYKRTGTKLDVYKEAELSPNMIDFKKEFNVGKTAQKTKTISYEKKLGQSSDIGIDVAMKKDKSLIKLTKQDFDNSLSLSMSKTELYSPYNIKQIEKNTDNFLGRSRRARQVVELESPGSETIKLQEVKIKFKDIKTPTTKVYFDKQKPLLRIKAEKTSSIIKMPVLKSEGYAKTQYEKRKLVLSPKQSSAYKDKTKLAVVDSLSLSSKAIQKNDIGLRTLELQGQLTNQSSATALEQISIQELKLEQQLKQDMKMEQKLSQRTKMEEQLKKQQRLTTITKETINPKTIPRPKPIKPFGFKLGTSSKSKKLKFKEEYPLSSEKFVTITKRYGKEKVLGISPTIEKATALGKQSTIATLGATIKVKTTSGKQIGLSPDKTFRTSLRDPLAIVQRKTIRLASTGERREIKESRRNILI